MHKVKRREYSEEEEEAEFVALVNEARSEAGQRSVMTLTLTSAFLLSKVLAAAMTNTRGKI